MFKIILFALLLVLQLEAKMDVADPYKDVIYYTLDNGMEVYLLNDDKAEQTAVRVVVHVGSALEDEKTSGLAHLVEHMVFRDQNVEEGDYLDYIKAQGGSGVNAYTKAYETEYLGQISKEKSLWLVETFAKMLSDINATEDDLEAEKGAVQNEIGIYKTRDRLVYGLKTFFETISPPKEDYYNDAFGVVSKSANPAYWATLNNPDFTLEAVKKHYKKYYYPQNMKLIVAGNFDVNQMKKCICDTFTKPNTSAKKTMSKPTQSLSLNHKPYYRATYGNEENSGFVGAKYLLDDYKRYLIVNAYMDNVAKRIQQHLRNKLGQSYGVSASAYNDGKAGMVLLNYDGLEEDFERNRLYIDETLEADARKMDKKHIADALKAYETNNYESFEHHVDDLLTRISTVDYLREEQNITRRTSFEIFKSITPQEFQEIVTAFLNPQNRYEMIYSQGAFFMYDFIVMVLFGIILWIFVYFKMYYIDIYRLNIVYNRRHLCLNQRLSNRFLGFLIFLFFLITASVIWEWIKYGVEGFIFDDAYYDQSLSGISYYVYNLFDILATILLFVFVYRYGVHYDARVEMDEKHLYLVGNRFSVYDVETFASVEVIPWSIQLLFKTRGWSLIFWRPLVLVTFEEGAQLYLRAKKADHLKEDIEHCLEKRV